MKNPALAEVWTRNLPSIGERVDTIERAVEAAEKGELGADLAAGAREAAHKLAGSLGSFGLARGSDLARELERRHVDTTELASALRAEIQR